MERDLMKMGLVCFMLSGGFISLISHDQNYGVLFFFFSLFPYRFRHNDLPWNIRKFLKNQLREFRFGEDLREILPWSTSAWSHTDLHRLKEGMVSAQVM
jgi:hypothetical protein